MFDLAGNVRPGKMPDPVFAPHEYAAELRRQRAAIATEISDRQDDRRLEHTRISADLKRSLHLDNSILQIIIEKQLAMLSKLVRHLSSSVRRECKRYLEAFFKVIQCLPSGFSRETFSGCIQLLVQCFANSVSLFFIPSYHDYVKNRTIGDDLSDRDFESNFGDSDDERSVGYSSNGAVDKSDPTLVTIDPLDAFRECLDFLPHHTTFFAHMNSNSFHAINAKIASHPELCIYFPANLEILKKMLSSELELYAHKQNLIIGMYIKQRDAYDLSGPSDTLSEDSDDFIKSLKEDGYIQEPRRWEWIRKVVEKFSPDALEKCMILEPESGTFHLAVGPVSHGTPRENDVCRELDLST